MDTKVAINDGNAKSSFMGMSEKKALKMAKEAELAFRKSKGYKVDTFWNRCLKVLIRK